MNTPIERLHTTVKSLGLKAAQVRLENLLEQAAKKEPSYADFLDGLLACKVDARCIRYLRARPQLAHLPFVKTLEQFDFAFRTSNRRTADSGAALTAIHPRGQQCNFWGAARRRENTSEPGPGGSRDPGL